LKQIPCEEEFIKFPEGFNMELITVPV